MAKNTIIVKAYDQVRDEKTATAVAITPGHLIERISTDLVQAHSIAGGPVNPWFAIEDAYQGKKITDDYAVSVIIFMWKPRPGDQIYAIADSGGAIVIGDFLESAGDGTLRRVGDIPSSAGVLELEGSIIAVALEAAAADARFVCELI